MAVPELLTLDHIETVNATRSSICILLATFFLAVGCATRTPDPLAGWHMCFSQDPNKLGGVIVADYQDYISRLRPKERERVGIITTFEDGTGQHAVKIEIGINGNWWQHVLIYNKDNKRIKAMRYTSGGYQS